jgi:hypothetical protein
MRNVNTATRMGQGDRACGQNETCG